jgi:hypothetical protein
LRQCSRIWIDVSDRERRDKWSPAAARLSHTTRHGRPDPILTAKIALAHLNEFPDYYTRLARMEEEATQPTLTN